MDFLERIKLFGMHTGRSWSGHPLEDACPCPKEPCGLVNLSNADENCEQHGLTAGKTMRQSHFGDECPGWNIVVGAE